MSPDSPPPEERPHPDGRRDEHGIRLDPDDAAADASRRAVLSILVDHEPGVLSEVSGLFSRRQFNIESLTVGPTTGADRARITVVCEEPEQGIAQIKKQVAKLLPVVAVRELPTDAIRRELAVVKVDADDPGAVQSVAEMYDATTVDACPETVTVEVTGSRAKVDAALETLGRFGVREYVRTGTTAMARSTTPTTTPSETADGDASARPRHTESTAHEHPAETRTDSTATDD